MATTIPRSATAAAAPRRGLCDRALVESKLREYGQMTRSALEEYLPRQEPREYLYDLVAEYPKRGGGMLRPSICIATARAFGATAADALLSAVALEILHNAFLIHRDIEDGNDLRRGRPSIHKECGVPMAINVGDTLSLISLRPLLRNRKVLGPRLAIRVLEESQRMARESAEGQAIELGWSWEGITDLDASDYLAMILKKTCWITTIYPSRVGALIATRDSIDLDLFVRFGYFLGAAHEICSDLVALGEAPSSARESGPPVSKRTLMMVLLLQRASPRDRPRLAELVRCDGRENGGADRARLRAMMEDYGCVRDAVELARALAGAARHEFSTLYSRLPASRDRHFLESLAGWVVHPLEARG